MASYAMAHLKMSLVLKETGFTENTEKRLRIYLTNSLEEHHPYTGELFANMLSIEANEANMVKRDTPVMVVIGNPPYSGESANKGKWIMDLMEDYKKEPGGKDKLKEQNSKFINDDYVKFIRYGQHFIEKNGSGVLAYINPHGYLDNPTFRGMRWNLLKTFDKIYTIDLHGNAKKKETSPDGSRDENVFDIMQGVSLNIFIKTGNKKTTELGKVFHFDLYGLRNFKYDFLVKNSLSTIKFNELSPFPNGYTFKNIDENEFLNYNQGINPIDLFKINVMGFQTHRDHFCMANNKKDLIKRLESFRKSELSESNISKQFNIKSSKDFEIRTAQTELANSNLKDEITKCNYRPFEYKYVFFNRILVDRPRKELISHSKNKDNLLLGIGRQGLAIGNIEWCLVTISKKPVDANMFRRGGVNLFPLYLYKNNSPLLNERAQRTPNLNMEIVSELEVILQMQFVAEKTEGNVCFANNNDELQNEYKEFFAPIDILDYIYAVLHSPSYRDKYKEFLKIDFPRVPYPKDKEIFWQLVKLGSEIRQTHLMESPLLNSFIKDYPFVGDGNNIVEELEYIDGKVYINSIQYFEGVPQLAWEFFIGGYQPAQKWLKDRRGNKLEYDDIIHYKKIIVALTETERLMKEIDRMWGAL